MTKKALMLLVGVVAFVFVAIAVYAATETSPATMSKANIAAAQVCCKDCDKDCKKCEDCDENCKNCCKDCDGDCENCEGCDKPCKGLGSGCGGQGGDMCMQ